MAEVHRVFVEKVTDISADPKTGIVKLTFAVDGPGGGDVLQMVVSAGPLREMFGKIGERMQSTFERGGRPGGPKGGGGPAANSQFKDLTE